MAISTQAVKYGWIALTGIALTGTTVYVGSAVWRAYQRDIIEIVVGPWERAEATRTASNAWGRVPQTEVRTLTTNDLSTTNPVAYTEVLTYVFTWRPDYAMLTNADATLKGAFPYYVASNAVATSNFTALSVGGVWASLAVGDSTSQFTRVPCHTNNPGETNEEVVAATFGDWARRLFVEPMKERYKVAWYLQKTLHTPQRYDLDLYQGTGKVWMFEVVDGDTPGTYRCTNYAILPADANDAAYLAAVADYKLVSNGVMSDVPFRQVSSNRYYYHEGNYVGEWQTNLVMTGGTNLIFTTNVIVDASESLPITNLYLGIRITGFGYDVSNIVVGSTGNYTLTDNTNALMMSGGDPDMSGGYAYDSFNNNYTYLTVGSVDHWDPGPALLVWLPDSERYSWTNSCVGCITGLYYPYDVPTNLSSGTVTGTWEVVSNSLSFDFSGTYITNGLLNGSNSWFCDDNDCYIYATNGQWVVATNDAVDLVNDLYLYANAPVGTYAASNFFTGSSTGGWDVTHYAYTNMDGYYYQDVSFYDLGFSWTNKYTETNSGHVIYYTNYNGTNMMYMPGDDPADWWFSTNEWWPAPTAGYLEPGGASLARHYYDLPYFITNYWFTNLPAWSGTYSNSVEVNGHPSWFCTNNGCYVYYSSDGLWQISTNVNIENTSTSAPFLWNSIAFPTGTYNASNFYITYATATYDYVTLATTSSPSGVYTPKADVDGKPAWESTNGYYCDSTDDYYRVWRDDGGHTDTWVELDQEMPPTGFGQVFTAYPGDSVTGLVIIVSTQAVKSWIVGTNAYVEYKLEKMGGDFNVYLSTNIEHRVEGAFAYTEAPDFADHNYYNDWTLGLLEDAWNNLGSNSWSFSPTNLVAIGGDLTVPPGEVFWEATVQNESGAEGFCVNKNLKAVGDWKFQYCTNKFW
jgi:hypothetical protein